ncbi:hypothetical protein Tco_1009013 [Tanacetum coccineum]
MILFFLIPSVLIKVRQDDVKASLNHEAWSLPPAATRGSFYNSLTTKEDETSTGHFTGPQDLELDFNRSNGVMLFEFDQKLCQLCHPVIEQWYKEQVDLRRPLAVERQRGILKIKNCAYLIVFNVSSLQTNQRSSGSMKKNLGTIPVARYVRRKLNGDESVPMCSDHGPQIYPAHRHNECDLTCFTPETKGLPMHEYEQLLQKVKSKVLEIPAELKAIHGKKHVFQLHVSHGCKKGRAEFILNDVFDHEPFAILPGTSELSVAPANVAISEMSDPPKEGVMQCVLAVSATKVLEMSTPPKPIEFKSVPRIMKTTERACEYHPRLRFIWRIKLMYNGTTV